MSLPPFPVDEETLDLLAMSLEEGCVLGTLELLSGYDPMASVPCSTDRAPDWCDLDEMSEYKGQIYDWTAMCRALIAEVKRLRAG